MLAGVLAERLRLGAPVALATVARVEGSAPREAGAAMLIWADGFAGTIGGGALEHRVIEAARGLIAGGGGAQRVNLPLGPEIGQCCGGRVVVEIEIADTARRAALAAREQAADRPAVMICGAGHVGGALARALAPLPLSVTIVDQRAEWLAPLAGVAKARLSALPEADLAAAPAGAAYVITTHDHGLDFMLTEAALARGDAAYVGMIGSATKRAALAARLRAANGPDIAPLTCPIGAGGPRDKRPEVIAALTAAEIAGALL